MRWRRKLAACAAVCALLVAGGLAWLLLRPVPPSARVNRGAFARIEPGMTPAEVETVIGLPPGDYRADPASPRHRAEILPKPGERVLEWEADDCNIQVRVAGGTGRVVSKICGEPLPTPLQEFLDDVHSRIGW
jgi:hypothetical protein